MNYIIDIRRHQKMFEPLMQSQAVQAAMMTLKPGESSSEKIENEHPAAEQWVYIVAGTGIAKIGRQQLQLQPGTLLYIPHRAAHQITNTGRGRLKTLNFYSPPAYTRKGNVKPAAKAQ